MQAHPLARMSGTGPPIAPDGWGWRAGRKVQDMYFYSPQEECFRSKSLRGPGTEGEERERGTFTQEKLELTRGLGAGKREGLRSEALRRKLSAREAVGSSSGRIEDFESASKTSEIYFSRVSHCLKAMLSSSKGISDHHLDEFVSEEYSFCMEKAFPSSVRLKPLRKGPFMRQQRIPVTETDLDVKEVRSSKEDEGVQQRDDVGSSVPDMEVIEKFGSVRVSHLHGGESLYRQSMSMESREISAKTGLQDQTAEFVLTDKKQGHPEQEYLEDLTAPHEQEDYMPANLMTEVMDSSPKIESHQTKLIPSVTKITKKRGARKSVQLDEPKKRAGRKKGQSKAVKTSDQLGCNQETPATEAAGSGKRRRVNSTRTKKSEIVKSDRRSQPKRGREQIRITPEGAPDSEKEPTSPKTLHQHFTPKVKLDFDVVRKKEVVPVRIISNSIPIVEFPPESSSSMEVDVFETEASPFKKSMRDTTQGVELPAKPFTNEIRSTKDDEKYIAMLEGSLRSIGEEVKVPGKEKASYSKPSSVEVQVGPDHMSIIDELLELPTVKRRCSPHPERPARYSFLDVLRSERSHEWLNDPVTRARFLEEAEKLSEKTNEEIKEMSDALAQRVYDQKGNFSYESMKNYSLPVLVVFSKVLELYLKM
ncbi:hypothetical protein AXG93_4520s1080 [Marchantia polymorpha subsp. ruderalis]|uniref:Uncharacterized protein n=1 Tax=Marchantia polymorpha subsp. ruderalis TaxID=1480154 RepID=A0A176VU63_MARPO|nr:hypothetical protein AXG93_4520s1080 [Marchantia polymorpha subsp. ruderalis]